MQRILIMITKTDYFKWVEKKIEHTLKLRRYINGN